MKNFACLILGLGLLVNLTMANPIENDAIDRFKRGSNSFKVVAENISYAKKTFIQSQIKTLEKTLREGLHGGKIAIKLRKSLTNNYGGRWMVLICEKDEICSFSHGTLPIYEYLKVFYGQVGWYVYRV